MVISERLKEGPRRGLRDDEERDLLLDGRLAERTSIT